MKTPRLALVLAAVLAAVAMPALFSPRSGAVRADGPLSPMTGVIVVGAFAVVLLTARLRVFAPLPPKAFGR